MPAHRFRYTSSDCPAEIRAGLAAIAAERHDRLNEREGAPLSFIQAKHASGRRHLEVIASAQGVEVRYATTIDAFRALGRLLGVPDGTPLTSFAEAPRFTEMGVMIDASRNGVLHPHKIGELLRRFALMGLNQCVLYTEDTFEVPGHPFFGYLRGAYTQEDLRAFNAQALALGIELVPCMQTLGHLEQVLQWPAYAQYRDTEAILLAEDEPTYAFIEEMILAASKPLSSTRIYIGMDEAHGLGQGRYKKLHGAVPPFEILNRHLTRVRAICAKHGLTPIIASDMYFRLGSVSGHYYDDTCVIPPAVKDAIPKDVRLVYWDYYHTTPAFYEDWIDRHRALGSEPLVWTGVWTWCRMWAHLGFSFKAIDACMVASKKKGIAEVSLCMWGDDGMESDVFSGLPGAQLFAEHGHAESVDPRLLRDNFRGVCGGELDDWVRASDLDQLPGMAEDPTPEFTFGMETAPNIAKWILWQDPALSFADPQFDGRSYAGHYRTLAADLDQATTRPGGVRLRFPAQLARVLAIKCDLRRHLAERYHAGDRAGLKALVAGELATLRADVDQLWKLHRAMWLDNYRPFGLEVIDQRYGGLRARLETLSDRFDDYLAGRIDAVPEIAVALHKIWDVKLDSLPEMMHLYHRLKSPSMMK
ncbi:MAG: beta-N-acetylhexosaminidase [Planctomycetes bacterium]|nr:beta-N-acetylhexosaminidase [Planctomycetota bacterium]